MIRRRAPRPTRGGRTTGTPRARRRLRRLGSNTPNIRPVRKKPVLRSTYSPKTTGALGAASSGAGSAAKAAQIAKLKEELENISPKMKN